MSTGQSKDIGDSPVEVRIEGAEGQLQEMLRRLGALIADGLRHGFFDYSVTCEIGQGGRRHLIIRAGKTHKFTIPESNLP